MVVVAQSCPTLCDPMDCNPPDSSVHGIFQIRILELVVIPFSRGSSHPRDWTWVSRIMGRFFTAEQPGKCLVIYLGLSLPLEKAMAPHSNTLAWKIPRTEEPDGLQSMGLLRVGHDSDFTFTFHFDALEKEMANHSGVLAWRILGTGEPCRLPSVGLQSRTRLKWLSSNSSSTR